MRRGAVVLVLLVAGMVQLHCQRQATWAAGTPNTWSTVAPLTVARGGLGAATSSSDGRLYAIDGQTATGYSGKFEAYTPSTNTWTSIATDPTVRTGVGVTAGSDGRVYAIGGTAASVTSVAKAYTPSTATLASLPALPTARYQTATVAGSDGRIYVIGGQTTASVYVATVEAYDPVASKWYCSAVGTGCTTTTTPPVAMPTARANAGVVAASNGLIYVIGGQTATGYTSVIESYNPTARTWNCSVGDTSVGCSGTTLTPMPTARTTKAAIGNGLIYAVGGTNGSYLNLVEVYNPSTNAWECSVADTATACSAKPLLSMPTARAQLAVATGTDGNVYALGGYNGTYLNTVESYTPLTVTGAPTGPSATAGDTTATVTWTAPTSTGGTPITAYTVNCSPTCTTVSVSGSTTSATVSGLTNGTAYTFTVAATNFVGGSASSAPSNSVSPAASCSTSTSNLSLAGATPGAFSTALNGSDQTLYTSLGTYTAANSTCSGWVIQFQASQFTNSTGDTLPANSLLMPAPQVSTCQSACGTGSTATAPSVCMHTPSVALDSGTAVTVASAASGTGKGSYTFTPGTLGTGNLQLTVPGYAYSTTYTSTLTVTVVQGPASSC